MEIINIKMSALLPNTGQVQGLPQNPRQWTASDVDRIANSLIETPELFEARPLLVYPWNGKYVILGGNLRHAGAKRNKLKECPCVVFPEDTPIDKLKEIIIKDNGSFGAWDFDMLANEWDDLPLTDWGIPAWKTDETKENNSEKEDLSDSIETSFKIEIDCANESEQEKMYNELIERGFQCRILTL